MRGAGLAFCALALSLVLSFSAAAAGGRLPEGVDILPTPKSLESSGAKFLLSDGGGSLAVICIHREDRQAVIAAEEINARISAQGGRPLRVVAADEPGRLAATTNVIWIMTAEQSAASCFAGEMRRAAAEIAPHGAQAYAIRFAAGSRGGRHCILVGAGPRGVLHAGGTLGLLIGRAGSTVFAAEAQITDWPDFANRGLPVWPLPASFDAFKKYLDWALRYKFNRIYTGASRDADAFRLPDAQERRYLRKVNAYARERGILINYAFNWAVGSPTSGGGRADFKDALLFNGHYYSWGDDVLLKRRAAELSRFARETGAGSLQLHCIDTYEEAWAQRGVRERLRFGNDRSAADANVVNIFTAELRRLNPGIELQFVAYPYQVNFDLPGNERYRAWMKSLSARIPGDVHLVVTGPDREQADSWVAATRQPLVHWVNGDAFQWGRYFSTLPAFTRSAYYPGRDRDVVVQMEPIGPFRGEVMQLAASEYEWNVEAPGSASLREGEGGLTGVGGAQLHYKEPSVEGVKLAAWQWYRGTSEPETAAGSLLLKACRLEFGPEAAPFMAGFFRDNPVGWRAPALFSDTLNAALPGEEPAASRDQLVKTDRALLSVKRALASLAQGDPGRERIRDFIASTYRQSLVISGMAASYQAEQSAQAGRGGEAKLAIGRAHQRLAEIKREMEAGGYWTDECRPWYAEGERRLVKVASVLSAVPAHNLVANPGFEAGGSRGPGKGPVSSWSALGALRLTGESHSGQHAAQLKLTSSDTLVYVEQEVDVASGCEAYLEFWLKKDAGFRVLPILQYRGADRGGKVELAAVEDFPSNCAVPEYRRFYGKLRLPQGTRKAVFKMFADWQGFTPAGEKSLFLDDVVLSCVPGD